MHFFKLEDNYNVLLVHAIQQDESALITYIYTALPWVSLPTPISPLQVITEHQAGLPVLYNNLFFF